MKSTRFRSIRHVAAIAAALSSWMVAVPAQATTYPTRPVTLVVPAPAGGGGDTIGRILSDALQKELKQPVIVDNRSGANGILGADNVAKAKPDGYRLLLAYTAVLVVNPVLYRKVPYDPVRDFAPIAQISRGGNLLLVRKDLPVKTVKEFAEYVRARPGALNYCSWGIGSGGHLAMEFLAHKEGLKMTHVPYKGSVACTNDLVGGQVQAAFADTATSGEMIRAGHLRGLALTADVRLPALPDVPTLTEAGYPFTTYSWYGLLAPAGTSPEIVAKLNMAVNRALQDPSVRKKLDQANSMGIPPGSPEEFGTVIRQDLKDWGNLIQSIGLQID